MNRWSLCATVALTLALSSPAWADYEQTNLVSDVPGLALLTDPNLVNPWGMSFSGASPFWVSNQGSNTSTLYTVNQMGMVSINALVVDIPHVGPPAGPTGQVQNNTTGFPVNGTPASFIFANLDGSISAWNGSAGTTAQVKVAPQPGSVYTGLAIGTPAMPMLYAANSSVGKIDVFNGLFAPVNLGPNAFKDPFLPAGLVPFNVQNIGGGLLYVTYAPPGHGAQISAPEGVGAVAIFDTNGKFIQHISDGGKMASPWGVALAPASFGEFGGDLLVGNFSYIASEINAFDPVTGAYLGTLDDINGNHIMDPGLWQIMFGNGGNGGLPGTLYLAAGIGGENHGLFAAVKAVPEPGTLSLLAVGSLGLITVCWLRRGRRSR